MGAFRTYEGLIEHQDSTLPSHDAHDHVVHSLCMAYQSGAPLREAAAALLFLVLRPALAAVYRQVLRHCEDEGAATGEIVLAFFERVSKWQPEKTTRVATNLKFNTLQTVMERRKRTFRDCDRIEQVLRFAEIVLEPDFFGTVPTEETTAGAAWQCIATRGDRFDLDDHEINGLRRFLEHDLELAKEDALLLVLKGPCHWSWSEIATRLHIKSETARKRHQTLR